MLNFVYYPVSFILWCWHKLFGFALGYASALTWSLAIVLLVFTVRAILLQPAVRQIRAMRRMQKLAPQLTAIRDKHKGDRQKQALELQKFQRENGVSPLAGCLPMLLQLPALFGLSTVLRGFTRYPDRPNYFFPNSDVHSYLAAKLFGANLGDAIFNTSLTGGGSPHSPWLWQAAPVAVPLMVIAAVATHLNARLAANRQPSVDPAGNPAAAQSAMMRGFSMWIMPLGALVFGGALPIGILVYWVSNNVWTLGQQYFVYRRIDAEEARAAEAEALVAAQRRAALTPKPGRKPNQIRNRSARGTGN